MELLGAFMPSISCSEDSTSVQRIVIKLQINSEKKRIKAMVTAASIGVDSVELKGEDKSQLVVVGDNVDSVCLTKKLRKKVHCAKLIQVEEVKPEKKTEEKKPEEKKSEAAKNPCQCSQPPYCQFLLCEYPNDPNPIGCSIL